MVLGLACFSYATVSSLGFVSTSRDTAVAARTADADAYSLAKTKADAAATELKALASAPAGNKKTEAARAKRRGELEGTIAAAEKVMSAGHGATVADPTAAAIIAYAGALGWLFSVDALPPWLSLLSVVFFELGAATSLIVLAALQPVPSVDKAEPATVPSAEPASLPGKQRGRKPAAPFEKVMSRLNEVGGKIEGPLEAIGERLGIPTKSSTHRTLNALAGAGLVTLATSAAGTLVQVR